MSHNTFGKLFRFTTWGESHGAAIGCVVDGCPPMIPLNERDIQIYLDMRKPGTSRFVTQRKEDDKVSILSGVFEGKTTGTPILLLIWNKDQKSKDGSLKQALDKLNYILSEDMSEYDEDADYDTRVKLPEWQLAALKKRKQNKKK